MKNLIYKELTLSINKFYFILPILLSCLFFIPNWLFLLIFMYFLWISVPQIYASYQANKDEAFSLVLPVTRKDIAKSRIYALIIMELYNIVLAVLFGIANNLIYGQANFFFDINPFFFGVAFIIFGIFNVVFLPLFFRTGYKFGKPIIIAIAVTSAIAIGLELLIGFYPCVANIFEKSNHLYQYLMLLGCVSVFVILNYITIKLSVKNYENIT